MIESAYNKIVQNADLQPDLAQIALAKTFDQYLQNIKSTDSLKTKILRVLRRNIDDAIKHRGLYIWGGVGRGKTMMMDLFFDHMHDVKKRRMHFHQFMSEFHRLLTRQHASGQITRSENSAILEVATKLARNYKVICLDELQVNNIADAMVLHRLFLALFRQDVFIFITSNFVPEELFKDGLQRDRFEPFIDLLNTKLDIFQLDNFQDYRLHKMKEINTKYYWPLDDELEYYMMVVLSSVLGEHVFLQRVISVDLNRRITVLKAYGTTAMFSFAELCKIPLGAADYMAICHEFGTIIITEIPQMKSDDHNEALRFITLVDCLYESKTKIICTAEVAIDDLYIGTKHQKEFSRAVSRLHEMC